MDTLATLLINAGNGAPIRDGVSQATIRASETFPYLAPPNTQTAAMPQSPAAGAITNGGASYDHYDRHEQH
jgi:hypothetical protein